MYLQQKAKFFLYLGPLLKPALTENRLVILWHRLTFQDALSNTEESEIWRSDSHTLSAHFKRKRELNECFIHHCSISTEVSLGFAYQIDKLAKCHLDCPSQTVNSSRERYWIICVLQHSLLIKKKSTLEHISVEMWLWRVKWDCRLIHFI